jgi:hypothetical protein
VDRKEKALSNAFSIDLAVNSYQNIGMISRSQLAKIIRWAGRIIAGLAIIFFSIYFTSFSFFGNVEGIDVPAWTYLAVMLALVLGLILVWWKDMTAAAPFLLLISAGIDLLIYQFNYSLYGWLILVLPFVIAIILLITLRLMARKDWP